MMSQLLSNAVKTMLKCSHSCGRLGVSLQWGIKHFHKSAPNNASWPFFRATPKTEARFKKKDEVPREFTLIYKATMDNYMRWGYWGGLICSLSAPTIMLYRYIRDGELTFISEYNAIPLTNPRRDILIFSSALILFTAALSAVVYKYPFRIYRNIERQEYIAVFQGVNPFKLQKVKFTSASEVKFKNPLYSLLTPKQFQLNSNKNVIMLDHFFRTPADLCEMLGME